MTWTPWEKVAGFDFKDIIFEKKFHKELGGGVARMMINRPEVLNAFTERTQDEIWEAVHHINQDAMIGVVVITGAGNKAFCAGGDVRWESKGGAVKMRYGGGAMFNDYLRRCRKPIIAAVKGYAIGAGNHIAYCCDFTIAAENAIFGQNGPRVGSDADGWIVSYLLRVVGAKKARELWMLCRRYNAQQALQMGLVNAVVPLDKLDDEVDRWCQDVLSLSPTCISVLKEAFDAEYDQFRGTFGGTARLIAYNFEDTPECKEAQSAFREKRQPRFWQIGTRATDKH